ncbi:MAG: fibronectin type III domain-containing protein [Pseudomonadota bacterium]
MKYLLILLLFILMLPLESGAADLSFCWDANKDTVSGYRLYMKNGNDEAYLMAWEGQSTCCKLADSILRRGELYLFIVRAFNNYGESSDSNSAWYISSEELNTMGHGGSCWISLLFDR